MRASSLFRRDVVNVRARYAKTALFCRTAAGACAPFFDRAKVVGVGGVAEVEYATGCDGIAKALGESETERTAVVENLRRFVLATRNRTCLRRVRQIRPGLRGSPGGVSVYGMSKPEADVRPP
jgi:hypothetical protein